MTKFKFTSLAAAFATAAIALTPLTAQAASVANVYLTPGAASVTKGGAVTVNIRENGPSVTTVTVNIAYDAGKLACSSASFTPSADFPNSISPSCGNGNAKITRYINPGDAPRSGDSLVAGLTFTSIATGSANVRVTNASVPNGSGNDWNGVLNASTITVNEPVVTPPVTGGGGGSTGSSTGGSAKTTNSSTTKKTAGSTAKTGNSSGQVAGTSTETPKAADAKTNDAKAVKEVNSVIAKTTKSRAPWVLGGLLVIALAVAGSKYYQSKTAAKTAVAAKAKKPATKTSKAKAKA